jgi:hypothetical protein
MSTHLIPAAIFARKKKGRSVGEEILFKKYLERSERPHRTP